MLATIRRQVAQISGPKEVTAPELGPVAFWSPKSSMFIGSDSNVGEGPHQVDSRGRVK